jgi:hypothetical protein
LAVEGQLQEAAGAEGFPNGVVPGIAVKDNGTARGVEEQAHRGQGSRLQRLQVGQK